MRSKVSAVASCVAIALFALGQNQCPQPGTVPNVVGTAGSLAQALITSAGLVVGTITEEYSETVPVNWVISQDPPAGTSAVSGAAVSLVVSKGRPAPFDASGVYTGTWQGQTTAPTKEEQQVIAACPLTLTLQQDVNAAYPANHVVTGSAVIEFSCLVLPDWVQQQPPASTVNVTGLLGDDGKLTLVSGGCGTGVCALLALAGQGADADGDQAMDTYSGAWSYTILLAGVQPFGVTGTFAVDRSPGN